PLPRTAAGNKRGPIRVTPTGVAANVPPIVTSPVDRGGFFRGGAAVPRAALRDRDAADAEPRRRGGSRPGYVRQGVPPRGAVQARHEPARVALYHPPQHVAEPAP